MWEQIEPFFRTLYIIRLKIEIVNEATTET